MYGNGPPYARMVRAVKALTQRKLDRYNPLGLSISTLAHRFAKRLPRLRQSACSFFMVVCIDHVEIIVDRIVPQAHDLLWGVLEIVIHGDYMGATSLAQASHDGVMLAEIARQIHDSQRYSRLNAQLPTDGQRIIRAAIVHQDNLQATGHFQPAERLDQHRHTFGAIVNWYHY